TFDREHASETVIQVARYALAGVLDETHLMGQKNGVAVAMPAQKAGPNMQPFHAEGGVARRTGTVSYCLAGGHYAQPTIVIDTVNSVPEDKLCIGFAPIAQGTELVAAFQPGTAGDELRRMFRRHRLEVQLLAQAAVQLIDVIADAVARADDGLIELLLFVVHLLAPRRLREIGLDRFDVRLDALDRLRRHELH